MALKKGVASQLRPKPYERQYSPKNQSDKLKVK